MKKISPITIASTAAFSILGGGVLAHLFGRKKLPSQGYLFRGTEYVDDNIVYQDGSSQPYLVRKRDGFLVPQPRTQKELLSEYARGDWIRRTKRRDRIVPPQNWYMDVLPKYEKLTPAQMEVVRKAKSMGFVDDVPYGPHNQGKDIYLYLYLNDGNKFVGIEFNENGEILATEGFMKFKDWGDKVKGEIKNYIFDNPEHVAMGIQGPNQVLNYLNETNHVRPRNLR